MAEQDTSPPAQEQALAGLMRDPAYNSRVCAPSQGNPAVCADGSTPAGLWATPDVETQEAKHQRERAAKRACRRCPLRAACAQYALDWEEWHVWGGTTAAERRRTRRDHAAHNPVPAPPAPTGQRTRVLAALAAHYAPAAVAAAAGMDERTAAWQRARLVTLLGLDPRTATRTQLLYAARTGGLLDPQVRIRGNGTRVVAAIPGLQSSVERAQPCQLPLPGLPGPVPVARGRRTALLLLPTTPAWPTARALGAAA